MKKPTVYIPQAPSRFDATINRWVPTADLSPAKEFGELKTLLPPEASRLEPEEIEDLLIDALAGVGPEDWIMATGSPAIMGAAMALMAFRLGGVLRVLSWDKRAYRYKSIALNLERSRHE